MTNSVSSTVSWRIERTVLGTAPRRHMVFIAICRLLPYNEFLRWKIGFTKKAEKQLRELPPRQRDFLELLVIDIQTNGPVRPDWPNYSKLGSGEHHCHLSYRYVACWKVRDDGVQLVEVYYAGTREGAPY